MIGFQFVQTVFAQSAAPPNIWRMSDLTRLTFPDMNSSILYVLSNTSDPYGTYFGFYTEDGNAFVLSVLFLHLKTVIWSANPDNPVGYGAILNFTRDGDLLLYDSNGSIVWSTDTIGKQVASMRLDIMGNLVLSDKMSSSIWQSFDHPTDTLMLGQSLCFGKSLSAKPSAEKWESSRIYLSADLGGLLYSFEPAAYRKFLQPTIIGNSTSTCYSFVNGSLGFPNQIIALPPARSFN